MVQSATVLKPHQQTPSHLAWQGVGFVGRVGSFVGGAPQPWRCSGAGGHGLAAAVGLPLAAACRRRPLLLKLLKLVALCILKAAGVLANQLQQGGGREAGAVCEGAATWGREKQAEAGQMHSRLRVSPQPPNNSFQYTRKRSAPPRRRQHQGRRRQRRQALRLRRRTHRPLCPPPPRPLRGQNGRRAAEQRERSEAGLAGRAQAQQRGNWCTEPGYLRPAPPARCNPRAKLLERGAAIERRRPSTVQRTRSNKLTH